MDNSQATSRYIEAPKQFEETNVLNDFDFEEFETFMNLNPSLTAMPTTPIMPIMPTGYDVEEHEALLDLPLRPFPSKDWAEDNEQPTVTPLSAPLPAMGESAELPPIFQQSEFSIPELPSLNLFVDYGQQPSAPIPQREQRLSPVYFNPILNSFSHPHPALKIIDRLLFPFSRELQLALEHELSLQTPAQGQDPWRQHSRHAYDSRRMSNNFQPIPGRTLPTSPPAAPIPPPVISTYEPSIADSTTKKAGSKRTNNIKKFNPTAFYSPLQHAPQSWGQGAYQGETLFQYTALGELNPTSTYSPQEIITYISLHPLNSYDTKRSGLTMWIQVAPADSEKRYGNSKSNKCRFECCPDPQRTIRKGDFRVAFDEQHSQGLNTDPFHNAGYVHLYCMEKFIDFPSICKSYNVRPDTRKLKEGKNKMAITRDHESMQDIVLAFIQTATPWSEFGGGCRPEDYYEHTLCYQLTVEHLSRQPKHLQKVREQRGGNSIDTHLNNLDKYLAGRKEHEDQRRAGLRPSRGIKGSRKRRADDEDDWDEVLDDDILETVPMSGRSAKRARKY